MVCAGGLPVGRHHFSMLSARTSPPLQPGVCSDGSEQARHLCIEPGMITPNITALSPGMGVVRDVPGG